MGKTYSYGLIYKGRPSIQSQKEAAKEQNADLEEIRYDDLTGVWRPTVSPENLPERHTLLERLASGDGIVIHHAVCLGITLADAMQALADILRKGGELTIRHGLQGHPARFSASERDLLDNFPIFVRVFHAELPKEDDGEWRFQPARRVLKVGTSEYEKIGALWRSDAPKEEVARESGVTLRTLYRRYGPRQAKKSSDPARI